VQPSDQPPGPAARVLRGAGLAARVRPWPHQPTLAHLVTLDQQLPLPSAVLRSWLNELVAEGYTAVRTGALAPGHRSPYDALGFVVAQQLTLLHLDVRRYRDRDRDRDGRPDAPFALRRARPDELSSLSRLDEASFPPGWGLDPGGLTEAVAATPHARVRIAAAPRGRLVGLAVTGRGGPGSFLQRLAVHPAFRRSGTASALVADSIRWAQRWRCKTMAVNTQHDNVAALTLYGRFGFEPSTTPLVVMERSLSGPL
jgi:GNAT superfamily N-acetyltransferase